jgi:glycosyltransferase involved in cell wall biosynthesis
MNLTVLMPAANDDYSLSLSIPAIAPFVDEIIVLDDDTPLVLQHLASQFTNLRYKRTERALGWTATRNQLLKETAAPHLLFIDADDIFCEWQSQGLADLVNGFVGLVQLGLIEAVGDFQHGTGRGFKQPHFDKCHCYINRPMAGQIEWRHNNTFSYVTTSAGLPRDKSPEILFCHAKGVKSDWRLCWRDRIRQWLRNGQDLPLPTAELHLQAIHRLLHSKIDAIRRIPDSIRLPSACLKSPRFEMVYENERIVDRIDRGFTPSNCSW